MNKRKALGCVRHLRAFLDNIVDADSFMNKNCLIVPASIYW